MYVVPTVPGVACVPGTCEAGPAEEERLKKIRAEAEARAAQKLGGDRTTEAVGKHNAKLG